MNRQPKVSTMHSIFQPLLLSICLFLLIACGGGGGRGSESDNVDNDNNTAEPVPASRVFYATSTGVFASDSDGNNQLQLTPDFSSGDFYANFLLSPDKAWVALLARLNGSGRFELYIVSTSGEHFTKVSVLNSAFSNINFSNIRNNTAWSPNSDAILYVADDTYDNRNEIYAVNINNDNTFTMPQKINGPIGATGTVSVLGPRWSFDGSHVAYQVLDGSRPIGVNTHEFGTQSGDANFSIRVSKPAFSATDTSGSDYIWSPVANQLVYRSQVLSANQELYIVNASEDQSSYLAADRRISSSGDGTQFPTWSDDGRYIAYRIIASGMATANWSVYDSNNAMPNAVKLVDDFGSFINLDWVPDSNRLSIYHGNGTGNQLTTLNPDGSNRLEIPIEDIDTSITLSPDGNLIALVELFNSEYRLLLISPTSSTIQREVSFNNATTDVDLSSQRSWSPNSDSLVLKRSETDTDILERIDTTSGTATTLDTDMDVAYIHRWSTDANNICTSKSDGTAINDLICLNANGNNASILTDDVINTVDSFAF